MTKLATRRLSMVQALNLAIIEEMRANGRVLTVGEDIRVGGGLYGVHEGVFEEFGEQRVLDMPISEAGFTGFGIGAAISGAPTLVEVQILDFIMVAMDQICNHAAKLHYMSGGQLTVPLVVRGPCTMGTGMAAQHAQNLEGWFADMPGLKVITPANASDTKGLLKAAIRDPNPVICIEHKLLYDSKDDVPVDEDYTVPIGKARIVQEGDDVTLIANSYGVRTARRAVRPLRERGISAEVIDLRTVRPLDVDTIVESVTKTGRAVVVSGASAFGGVAGRVTQEILGSTAFGALKGPILAVGAPDIPVPFAKELEDLCLPGPNEVVETVVRLFGPDGVRA